MTSEARWKAEWEVLRAERLRARRQWRGAADGLAARVRDPLQLGRLVRDHPVAAGGIGAAVAALLVKQFFGRASASQNGADRSDGAPRPQPAWPTLLRDAAVSIAVPWLVRMVKDRFGWDVQQGDAPAPDVPRAPAAEQPARR